MLDGVHFEGEGIMYRFGQALAAAGGRPNMNFGQRGKEKGPAPTILPVG